ncbi:MAG: alpha/beta hydrolase [Xanthomonadales bacterium]|nr:alpha/beta hydrolase [Xanthomonadales bacterium]
MRTDSQEIKLKTPFLELAALRWGDPAGIPLLALHGWLDNAASFLPMAQYFDDMNMVALDWPGHGHSEHRHPSASYHVTEFMWDIHAAMDALGWDSCHLLGHSLGAAVSSIFATAAPERLRSITLIDALGPYANQASETAQQLRRSSAGIRSKPRPRKTYASVDDMVQARLANSDLTEAAARLITGRSVNQTADGFQWSYDPGLYWTTPHYFSAEQILDCFRHIETPTLTISAMPFASQAREQHYQQRTQAIPNGRHELIEGGHHMHMELPEVLGKMIHDFIAEYDDPAMALTADN